MIKIWKIRDVIGTLQFGDDVIATGYGKNILDSLNDGKLQHGRETLSLQSKNLEQKLTDVLDNPYCMASIEPNVTIIEKGGPGSGDFGHRGRPGKVGGSAGTSISGRLTISSEEASARKMKRIEQAMQARANALKGGKKFGKELKETPKDYYSIMSEDELELANDTISMATNGKVTDAIKFIYNAYVFKHEESGVRTEVNAINARYRSIEVFGDIYDANGKNIGEFQRIIHSDGEVHNEYLKLDRIEQGSGFGAKLYENSELTYLEAGIENVTIYANIDVGGYAWARMGFDFVNDANREDIHESIVRNYARKHKVAKALAINELANSWGITSKSKAWEFAAFTDSDGDRIGKKVMLGSDWFAKKSINLNDEGFLVGMNYYAKKK